MIYLGSEFCDVMCGRNEVSFQSSFIYIVFLTLVVLTSPAR